MLLISSRMTTVLPTPAPPNAPTLPPLVKGQIRSMTLMPVSRIVRLRVLLGQLGRLAVNRITFREMRPGPRLSTGSPVTLKMRPRVPSPTGTEIGPPVSVTGMPRFKPFGRRHRDRADPVFAEMLLHFEGELGRVAVHFVLDLERVVDAGQLAGVGEIHVDDGTDDLDNITSIHKEGDPRGELPSARETQGNEVAPADKRKTTAKLRARSPAN